MSAALAVMRLGELLSRARAEGASDVHISASNPPMLRICGVLQPFGALTDAATCAAMVDHILDARAGAVLAKRGEVTVRYDVADGGPFRIHVYRSAEGLACAARVLGVSIPALDTLGLPAVFSSFTAIQSGLILFGGPTGSGKTTSLAALVARLLSQDAKHVLVIEDPSEYRYGTGKGRLTAREVGRDTPSFAEAVQGALRSDPDVLVVGEMRDAGTMRAVLTAAETGHLVLSTVHTADAAQSIDRVIHAFAKDAQDAVRTQLAQTLAAIVCQRLIVRCKDGGRCAVAEVLIATDAVRTLIREAKTHQLRNVIVTGRARGMQTLEEHLSERVMRGEVSAQAARAATNRPNDVRDTFGVPG